MKKYKYLFILLFLLIFLSNKCLAQNRQIIDSLKNVVKNTVSDSIKAITYANISWNYAITRTKLDTAKLYADSLKLISKNNNDNIALSNFYYGVINRFEGNHYNGISYIEKFITHFESLGDSSRVASGLFQFAVLHNKLGNYEKSLEAYYRVLNIHKMNNYLEGIGFTLHSIGHLQRKLNKHQEAIKSYEESITLKKEVNDVSGISMSLVSLGNTYAELKQYSKAEKYLISAISYAEKVNQPFIIAAINENLGNLYYRMNEYPKALELHSKALITRETLPSKSNLALSQHKVGKTYLKLGALKKAKTYLFTSLLTTKEMKNKPLLMDNYESIIELYEFENNIKDAYKYQKLFIQVKDSIFNSEKIRQMAELETKYQTAQKDQKIALLTTENELKEKEAQRQDDIKKAILIGLFLTLLFAGLLYYTQRQKLKNQKLLAKTNEELKVSNLKKELGTLEMKALRAQMNPHFLFNSLNSINTMILRDDNANASKYLTKFSKLVRLMLENSENPKVTLQDEIDMLNAYVALESIRFKGKIEYELDVSKDIDKETTLIPSMVLQPFVENAIWHGLLHAPKKTGKLSIKVTEKDDFLYCSILDNGVGREAALKLHKKAKLKNKSMGIKITTERLTLLTKEKIKEVVKIIDLKDDKNNALGTQVDILIPIS